MSSRGLGGFYGGADLPAYRVLGANVMRERKARGWSRRELEEALDMGTGCVKKIELAHHRVAVLEIVVLADCFGVSVDALVHDMLEDKE